MAQRDSAPIKAPKEFTLEFGAEMAEVPLDEIAPETFVEAVRLAAGSGEPWNARGVHLVGVLGVGLDLSGAQWGQARVRESAFQACSAVALQGMDARLEQVEFEGSRVGVADFSGAGWEQVVIRGGKTNELNLRYSAIKDVRFSDTTFGTVDLAHARAERVSFIGCRIDELVLHSADLAHLDLRGADIRRVVGVESLRGTVIDEYQLSALAPQFAEQLGITVL